MSKGNRPVKIRVNNLTKKFGDLLVLDDISFEVEQGEFLCIVGPTGCGKTTFLNSLTKLYDITEGEILVNEEPVDLDRHNIAYIFQEDSTMPWLTVEQNVAFGLEIKGVPKNERKERVDEFLELVGLTDSRNYYPSQLSVSMLQRVSIARAFAVGPELLLMDEPYGQLDISLRFKLEDELVYQEGFLASVLKKLSNEKFISKAPQKVLDNERKKEADSRARIATIKESLAHLKK